jgi:ABC-type lipopolysaccharide export system ATPase subunit
LKSASFKLHRGEILGIAGLMGSGRTPLLRTIFGLERPESGTIEVNKKSLRPGSSTPAMRLIEGLGYLSEDRKGDGLTLNQSIADNVTVTRFNSCSRWGWLDLGAQRKQTEKLVSALKIRAQGAQQEVGSLVGRQSAEGDRGASAAPGCGRASARRADARHRHRQQGAGLRNDCGVCGAEQSGVDGELVFAGVVWDV